MSGVSQVSGAVSLSFMSCVRDPSPPQEVKPGDYDKNGSKKRFWNPRKWFKRKGTKSQTQDTQSSQETLETPPETFRCRSLSQLSVTEDNKKLQPGLSVSHDSVFHSPNSFSEGRLNEAQSLESERISPKSQVDQRLQSELTEKLRLRRGRGNTSEDDEGLPRSPQNSGDDDLAKITQHRDIPVKSHSSSDGSLLSVGSIEIDEYSPGHSSKVSLRAENADELDLSTVAPSLNHSAAHHRKSLQPKRTHGPPRRKRNPQASSSALPTTIEVSEDNGKAGTPEAVKKERLEAKLKCSSLPPGLAPPGGDESKLSRSKSNASSKSEDALEGEGESQEKKHSENSFFSRLFLPRRSAKKTKQKIDSNFSIRPNALIKSGPASRQRVAPLDIPLLTETSKPMSIHEELVAKFSPEKETKPFLYDNIPKSPKKTYQDTKASNSKAQSKNNHEPKIVSQETKVIQESRNHDSQDSKRTNQDPSRSRVKIAGLSSLQQRVISLQEDTNSGGFKSLIDVNLERSPTRKPVTKSQSFKSTRSPFSYSETTTKQDKNDTTVWDGPERPTMSKESKARANSLDSVKNLDVIDPNPKNHRAVVKIELEKSSNNLATNTKSNKPDTAKTINVLNATKISAGLESIKRENAMRSTNVDFSKTESSNTKTESNITKSDRVSITKIHVKGDPTLTMNFPDLILSPPGFRSQQFADQKKLEQKYEQSWLEQSRKLESTKMESKIVESKKKVEEHKATKEENSRTDDQGTTVEEERNNTKTEENTKKKIEETRMKIEESSMKLDTKIKLEDTLDIRKEIEENKKKIEENKARIGGNKSKSEESRVKLEEGLVKSEENRVNLEEIKLKMDENKLKIEEIKTEDDKLKTEKIKIGEYKIKVEEKVLKTEINKIVEVTSNEIKPRQFENRTKVDENKGKLQEEKVKHEESIVKHQENKVRVEELKTKREETKFKHEESKVKHEEVKMPKLESKLEENKVKLDENKFKFESNKAKPEITKNKPDQTRIKTEFTRSKLEDRISLEQNKENIVEDEKKHSDPKLSKLVSTAFVTVNSASSPGRIYKKNGEKSANNNNNDTVDDNQTVVLRKKSLGAHKKDDTPELMKVFARRSLKLKESESEELSQELANAISETIDKENNRIMNDVSPEVELRNPNSFNYQRTASLTISKPSENNKIHKQTSLIENSSSKVDTWSSNYKNHDCNSNNKISNLNNREANLKNQNDILNNQEIVKDDSSLKITQEEIISSISEKTDYVISPEPKNFNQRKAEWERRAQDALRKTVP